MRLGNTTVGPVERVLWAERGVTIKARRPGDGGVSLIRVTDYDSGPARAFDLPRPALEELLLLVAEVAVAPSLAAGRDYGVCCDEFPSGNYIDDSRNTFG